MLPTSLSRSSSSQLAHPVSPHTIWSVRQLYSVGIWGLAELVSGLRWTTNGAFCPAAPWGQVERVNEAGVFMFHVLPPPPLYRGQDAYNSECGEVEEGKSNNRKRDKGFLKGKCDVIVWKCIFFAHTSPCLQQEPPIQETDFLNVLWVVLSGPFIVIRAFWKYITPYLELALLQGVQVNKCSRGSVLSRV